MSDLKVLLGLKSIPEGSQLILQHVIQKRESIELTIFHEIGLLYRTLDTIAQVYPEFASAATNCYDSIFRDYGFSQGSFTRELMSATEWKNRMFLAWNMVLGEEREVARKIDYEQFHNYWPTLDFCSPSWDDEVEKWSSGLMGFCRVVQIADYCEVGPYTDSDRRVKH